MSRSPSNAQAGTGTREDDTLPQSEGAGVSARAALSFRKAAVRSARVLLRAWAICSLEFNEEGNGFRAHWTNSRPLQNVHDDETAHEFVMYTDGSPTMAEKWPREAACAG